MWADFCLSSLDSLFSLLEVLVIHYLRFLSAIQSCVKYPLTFLLLLLSAGFIQFLSLFDLIKVISDCLCSEWRCTLSLLRPRFGAIVKRFFVAQEALDCFGRHLACVIFYQISNLTPWPDRIKPFSDLVSCTFECHASIVDRFVIDRNIFMDLINLTRVVWSRIR